MIICDVSFLGFQHYQNYKQKTGEYIDILNKNVL